MKISKKQFIQILTENAGLFSRTARAIQKQYGVKMTRQSVRERAMKYPEILKEIAEENIDLAEEGLHSLMHSKNPQIKLKAIELFLRTKGRTRGYVTESKIDFDFNQATDEQLQMIIDNLLKKI